MDEIRNIMRWSDSPKPRDPLCIQLDRITGAEDALRNHSFEPLSPLVDTRLRLAIMRRQELGPREGKVCPTGWLGVHARVFLAGRAWDLLALLLFWKALMIFRIDIRREFLDGETGPIIQPF